MLSYIHEGSDSRAAEFFQWKKNNKYSYRPNKTGKDRSEKKLFTGKNKGTGAEYKDQRNNTAAYCEKDKSVGIWIDSRGKETEGSCDVRM